VDVKRQDEKSIMTYVAQFLHKYPDRDTILDTETEQSNDPREIEKGEHRLLLRWLEDADKRLEIVDSPIQDPAKEYQTYLRLREEHRIKEGVYERLVTRSESNELLVLNDKDIAVMKQKWSNTSAKLNLWRWKLDSALPGEVGRYGDWLHRAEETIKDPELCNKASDLVMLKNELSKRSAILDGAKGDKFTPEEQLNDMKIRTKILSQQIDTNIPLLEYKDAKLRLSEYLNQIENSLKECEKKHGEVADVESTILRFNDSIGDEKSLNENYESLKKRNC